MIIDAPSSTRCAKQLSNLCKPQPERHHKPGELAENPHNANTSVYGAVVFPQRARHAKQLISFGSIFSPDPRSPLGFLFEWVQPRQHPWVLRLDVWLRRSIFLPSLISIQRDSLHRPRGFCSLMTGWRTGRWNSSPILMRVDLRPVVWRLVDWWWYMIGIVGYAVSFILACFQPPKSYVSYLEEDTLAWGNLHRPSQVHSKQTEVEDRIEPDVAWGPETREP